jgi:hypothetical protein
MTGRVKAGAAIVAGVLGAGAAIAIGSVPDGDGTFHACYTGAVGGGTIPANGANIRLIDPSAGQSCEPASNEHAFTFSAQGPQGIQGAQGLQGPPGPPGADGTGTLDQPQSAGHVALKFPGGRTRSGLAGTTLQLDVLSIGYGVTGPAAKGAGYVTKSSPPPVVNVTRLLDKYSSALQQACAAGKHFPTVVLTLFGGKAKLTLTGAYLTSVAFTGSHNGSGDHLEEADAFVAEKIKTEYAAGSSNLIPKLSYTAKLQGKL